MDLFDVLSMDERVIVYSSLEDGVIYTWNNTDTFQCWARMSKSNSDGTDNWQEGGILTQSGYGPKTYEQAREVAIAWHTGSLDRCDMSPGVVKAMAGGDSLARFGDSSPPTGK